MSIAETNTLRSTAKVGRSGRWLVARILLPFAFAYFLSYLLRNLNATIAPLLLREFELDAGQLGGMTASYFLGFALMQIPIGICLDRFSPRVVQALLYVVAATGVWLFSIAHSPTDLLMGRLLIGIGVAGGLVAGLKSIALWFPSERVPVVNGVFIALGTLGAVAATVPAEWLLSRTDWRGLFLLLALACASTVVFCFLVPKLPSEDRRTVSSTGGYGSVLRDPRLWRLAPLSGFSIGSAWALQGLWAGPWLSDVGGFDHSEVVRYLLAMSLTLSLGALELGAVIRLAKRWGINPSHVLVGLVLCLVSAELTLALRLPVPSIAPWCVIGLVGAGTVATYSITASLFEKSVLGRVNGVINLFHIGSAFVMQSGVGMLVTQWHQTTPGHYPPNAYSQAVMVLLAIQLAALIWYLRAKTAVRNLSPISQEP